MDDHRATDKERSKGTRSRAVVSPNHSRTKFARRERWTCTSPRESRAGWHWHSQRELRARDQSQPRQRSIDLDRKYRTKRARVVVRLRLDASRNAPRLFQRNDWLGLSRVRR